MFNNDLQSIYSDVRKAAYGVIYMKFIFIQTLEYRATYSV